MNTLSLSYKKASGWSAWMRKLPFKRVRPIKLLVQLSEGIPCISHRAIIAEGRCT